MANFTLLKKLVLGARQYTMKDENVKKCIRMGITMLEIVIWRGKLSVLWLQISDHEMDDLPHKMTILRIVTP